MDYKELIDRLITAATFCKNKKTYICAVCLDAATAIETLLAERGADLRAQQDSKGVEIDPPPPNDPPTLDELREMDGEPVKVVYCKDCKHLYFKDFSAFCPHRVGAVHPNGFCELGECRKPEESNET